MSVLVVLQGGPRDGQILEVDALDPQAGVRFVSWPQARYATTDPPSYASTAEGLAQRLVHRRPHGHESYV